MLDFCLIFNKIDDEQHIDVWLFFVMFFVCFSNARNLENRAPVLARVQFSLDQCFEIYRKELFNNYSLLDSFRAWFSSCLFAASF